MIYKINNIIFYFLTSSTLNSNRFMKVELGTTDCNNIGRGNFFVINGFTSTAGGLAGQITPEELGERLEIAGIQVMEARIGYLAYAEEIASAMLRRQQATAIIAAREKIVEGAVGMVENALEQLKDKDIVTFDQDKKATMVSNLMVVLCSDKEVTPVVNTGSLYQ